MRKLIMKAVAFLAIFCILFLAVQEVIRYKAERIEDIRYRYDAYLSEPENSIDILFIGSSPVCADIAPTLIWEETGMTSFNFGVSHASAMINYYQLRWALEAQKPSLVVVDFSCTCQDKKIDSEIREADNRRNVAALPDWMLRSEMILQIGKDNVNQNIWTYFFPLLQYHSRWNEISETDFIDTQVDKFQTYNKGALFLLQYSEDEIIYDPTIFEQGPESLPISEYSWGYYQKMLNLCAENDIPVAVVSLPVSTTAIGILRTHETVKKVCVEIGLNYYDMNAPTAWEAYGFDTKTDFYDDGHMNANGAVKLSKALAEMLQADYGLPDHRGDEAYSAWENDWNSFYKKYKEVLQEFGY